MKWHSGYIGIELMAAISLSAFYGVANLRRRADRLRLDAPCALRADCTTHPIAVRSPKFGRALLATSAAGGLLVPYAALTGRTGRAGIAATLTAAGSLALALALRYEFVQVDQERRDRDNGLAMIIIVSGAGEDDDEEDDFLDSRNQAWLAA